MKFILLVLFVILVGLVVTVLSDSVVLGAVAGKIVICLLLAMHFTGNTKLQEAPLYQGID